MNTRMVTKLAAGMTLGAWCAVTLALVPGVGDARAAAAAPNQDRIRMSWFEKCDADKDGLLSKSEYETFVLDRARVGAEKRFTNMDGNKDGFVSREERDTYARERATVRKEGKNGGKDRRQGRRPREKRENLPGAASS